MVEGATEELETLEVLHYTFLEDIEHMNSGHPCQRTEAAEREVLKQLLAQWHCLHQTHCHWSLDC